MKKGVLLVLILSVMLIKSANFVCANEMTNDYLEIAQNYINANNYAKAIDYLNEIIKIEPNNKTAIDLKNKISPQKTTIEETKTADETAKELTKVQSSPQNVVLLDIPSVDTDKISYDSAYYNQKGREYYNIGQLDTAAEFFFKAIKLNKKDMQSYNNLGMTYYKKKNYRLAITYLKKANRIDKSYSQPLVNLSEIYRILGNEKQELKVLKKAIKYNPSDYNAYTFLGEYYRLHSQFKEAITNYSAAIEINPTDSDAYFGLGFSYFDTEDFNYAASAFSKYIELNPNSDFVYYMLSKSFLVLEKYDFAKAAIEKAIEINNSNDYAFELVEINYYLGDYRSALDGLEMLMLSSNSAEYFNYAGLCNYKMKNLDAAIANFNKAIELDSLRPIYYYNLAQAYKSVGDKRNYVKYVNTATKITPIKYQDYIDLSYIYSDNGNTGFAVNTLNDAIKKYPTVKALYLSKLKIFEAVGDTLNYNETKDEINERFNGNENNKNNK